MKNKKIIIMAIVLTILGATLTTLFFITKYNSQKSPGIGTSNKKDSVTPPSYDTQSLKQVTQKLEVDINSTKLSLKNTEKIKDGDRVKAWIYSQPLYLGLFTVKDSSGAKEIIGVYEAINSKIVAGLHTIALTTEKGDLLGYIEIEITMNNEIKLYAPVYQKPTTTNSTSNTETLVVVEESIAFASRSENEVNQARGTTVISQAGQEGTKKVTYKVITGNDGKQLSRTKISEQVTKQPIEQITKVGLSDYNLNDNIQRTGFSGGLICLAQYYQDYGGGNEQCPYEDYGDASKSGSYTAYHLNIKGSEKRYIYCMPGCNFELGEKANMTPVLIVNSNSATVGGINYKITLQGGYYDAVTINESFCNNYGLACGRW